MASKISDAELRHKLKELGEDVGPITDSTRYLWQKKLNNLLNDQKKNLRKRSVSKSVNSKKLGGFSSDEGELDLTANKTVRSGRKRVSTKNMSDNSGSDLKNSPKKLPLNFNKHMDENDFKIPGPVPLNSKKNLSHKKHLSRSCASGLTRHGLNNLNGSVRSASVLDTTYDVDSSDSDVDFDRQKLSLNHSRQNSLLYDTSFPTDVNKHASMKKNISSKNGNYGGMYHFIKPLQANGVRSGHNRLADEFMTEEDSKSSTNYSHCVSMLLLVITLLFFIVLGLLYIGFRQRDLNFNMTHNSISPPAYEFTTEHPYIRQDKLESALALTKALHSVLIEKAGKFECEQQLEGKRNITVEEAKLSLKNQEQGFKVSGDDEDFRNAVLLIAENPSWGIRLYTRNGENFNILNYSDVHTLESTKAAKPFLCRLRQATKKAFWQVVVMVLVIVLAYGCMQYAKFSKRKREEEWKALISMIERIIEILKHQYEASRSDPSIKGYVAISHIRDMLIPLSERKSKENLWKKVVKFLEENESRVRVEDQYIAGEVFSVWRWIQTSTPENSNKKDKVWQGQAFGNGEKSPNMLPFAPTPCLKIRNMFDPEVEYGDDWHVRIEDAILEKCEGNSGIVHMYVDKSSKEGCVFLKCNTLQTVREAYSSLHGWWFDGKLVTVKYLRLERYHERFPSSRYSTMPLKPSNNMRLSLSVPFQNSVLEIT